MLRVALVDLERNFPTSLMLKDSFVQQDHHPGAARAPLIVMTDIIIRARPLQHRVCSCCNIGTILPTNILDIILHQAGPCQEVDRSLLT